MSHVRGYGLLEGTEIATGILKVSPVTSVHDYYVIDTALFVKEMQRRFGCCRTSSPHTVRRIREFAMSEHAASSADTHVHDVPRRKPSLSLLTTRSIIGTFFVLCSRCGCRRLHIGIESSMATALAFRMTLLR